jgi:hypothetical protein
MKAKIPMTSTWQFRKVLKVALPLFVATASSSCAAEKEYGCPTLAPATEQSGDTVLIGRIHPPPSGIDLSNDVANAPYSTFWDVTPIKILRNSQEPLPDTFTLVSQDRNLFIQGNTISILVMRSPPRFPFYELLHSETCMDFNTK